MKYPATLLLVFKCVSPFSRAILDDPEFDLPSCAREEVVVEKVADKNTYIASSSNSKKNERTTPISPIPKLKNNKNLKIRI